MPREATRHLAARDPVLAALIDAVGPCPLAAEFTPGDVAIEALEPFRALTRAITFQQLNGAAARVIFERFVALYPAAQFPSPQALLATPDERLRSAGLSRGKIAAIRDLAAKVLDGTVPRPAELARLEDAVIIERVSAVRGVGRWTVEMMLMFQLGRPDVLPCDDYGVRTGFRLAYGLRSSPAPLRLARYGEIWRPYRSTAAWYLWRAVELARASRLPAPAVRIRLPRLARAAKRRRVQRPRPASARRTPL